MSKWQSVLIAALLLAGLHAPNAQAQDVEDTMPSAPPPPPSPGLRIQQQQQQQPARNYTPGVRYTTGSVTVSGWEKGLTDGDHNLRHWNWSAVTSYTQSSYGKVPPGAYLDKSKMRPPGGIYVKPIHISPDTYANNRAQVYVPSSSSPTYTANSSSRTGTGAKLLAPRYEGARADQGNQAATNVSAKVKFSRPAPPRQVEESAPVARTYGGDYTSANVGGQIMSNRSTRTVQGKLMDRVH